MSLFFSLLPIYLFGNIHCAGMCGPLMMLLAKNRYRWMYFAGRLTSYTLAGLFSAEAGMFFFQTLSRCHLSALLSIAFGCTIVSLAFFSFFRIPYPGSKWLAKKTSRLSTLLAKLLSVYGPYPVFFFGACTLLLPCGQTLVVFSACALDAKPLSGLVNGFLFALFTSPSLALSMSAFKRIRNSYHLWIGFATLVVGFLALFRGLADLDLIPHLILNPKISSEYHIVFF